MSGDRVRIKTLEERLSKTYISGNKKKENKHNDRLKNITQEEEAVAVAEAEDHRVELMASGEGGGSVSKLPSDIVLDIISRLPIKALKRCMWVCKSWYYAIHSPCFTKLHFDRALQHCSTRLTSLLIHHDTVSPDLPSDLYLVELDHQQLHNPVHKIHGRNDDFTILNTQFNRLNLEYEVVGSCNGLLCLSEPLYYDPVYVCNPVIGEYMTLPLASERTDYDIVSGFGFDSVNNEYKVIRMLYRSMDPFQGLFDLVAEVYTIGSGRWRRLGNVPYPARGNSSPANVNGVLHWMTNSYWNLDVSRRIVSFDVSREVFGVLLPPPGYGGDGEKAHSVDIEVLGGCLCFFDNRSGDHLVIWLMKEYGVKESWTKEYVVERPLAGREMIYLSPLSLSENEEFLSSPERLYLRPLSFLENKEILFSCQGEALMCYEPVQKRFRALTIRGLPRRFNAIAHVGSLVSLGNARGISSGWRGGAGYQRWSTTLCPIPSHNPKIDIEKWLSEQGLQAVGGSCKS